MLIRDIMCSLSDISMKKLLIICSTLDLELPYGLTPAIWQMLKALYELGCENIVVPYRGKPIQSLWWRCYDNPVFLEGEIYNLFKKNIKIKTNIKQMEGMISRLTHLFTIPKFKKHLEYIFKNEPDIEGVLFIQIPLNQVKGIPTWLKKTYDIPILYFESDVPTSLPQYGGFSFNHFLGSDLSEFDALIIPSEGSKKYLFEMGARAVNIMHFGVDPDVFKPISTQKKWDVYFSGIGSKNREYAIYELITKPSLKTKYKFLVSGNRYDISLGNAQNIPPVPFNSWREYCCGSKINLNIPRMNHAKTYATSTSRPFELAAMKCCIISSEYDGLDNWFDLKNEILIARDSNEAIELYEWLLTNDVERNRISNNAYNKVLKEHTFKNRCEKLLNYFKIYA